MSSSEEDGFESADKPVTLDEILSWTRAAMVEWLSERKLPKTGRRKEILAKRIVRVMEGHDSVSEYSTDCSDDEVTAVDIPNCPGKDDRTWVKLTQPEQIPNIREEDVVNYYLHGKNPVTGCFKNCRRYLEKAKKYGKEPNYIGEISTCSKENFVYFKCYVKPSMKKGMYYTTVVLHKDTGLTAKADCQCKVGAVGLCAHVGGAMLRLVRLRNPCTTKLCGWAMPSSLNKPVTPQRLRDINFWPGKEKPDKPWSDAYKAGPCEDDSDAETFREEVLDGLALVNQNCVLYIHHRKSTFDITPFKTLFDSPFVIGDEVNLAEGWVQDHFLDFVEDLKVSKELSMAIERCTRGQSCNHLWKEVRTCILTASHFGRLVHLTDASSMEKLVAQLCCYTSVPKTLAMLHGNKLESRARKSYMKHHQRVCGLEVKIQNLGVVVSPEWSFLGASLDGLIQCPKCGTGCLEIKCPWTIRFALENISEVLVAIKYDLYVYMHLEPSEAINQKTPFCDRTDDNGNPLLKERHKYWYQIQGQMAVTGIKWSDFVIFTYRGISVERIKFDGEYWDSRMLPKLRDFFTRYRTAEIFTNRVKRGLMLYKPA